MLQMTVMGETKKALWQKNNINLNLRSTHTSFVNANL